MRTPLLILTFLGTISTALVGASGCVIAALDCDPARDEFTVDADLSEADVRDIVAELALEDREQISCAEACAHAYRRDSGWETREVDGCTWQLDAEPGAEKTDVVAHVTCDGDGVEFLCDA